MPLYAYIIAIILVLGAILFYAAKIRKKEPELFLDHIDYWTGVAETNGVDISKLKYTKKNGIPYEWYYDGKPTCIAAGNKERLIPEGLVGSTAQYEIVGYSGGDYSGLTIGEGPAQMRMVKHAVENGGLSPLCPR